jgi:hypothetical protein
MRRATIVFFFLAAFALVVYGASTAEAYSNLYTSECQSCHGATSTCAGCHAHGVHSSNAKSDLNVSGTTDKTTYAAGETVSVTITGGYRSGWVRAILYDQNMNELARSVASFPITLTAPAPAMGGTYTWNVAWYGNQYDLNEVGGTTFFGPRWTPDPNNTNHGQEIVSTNAFTVAAAAEPDINLSPASLDFGMVAVNSATTQGVQIQNLGSADLTVTAIALCAGTSTEYSWSPMAPFTVAPGGSQLLSVTYSPLNDGTDTGCLAITSNDPDEQTVQLGLTGTGYTPQPAMLDLDIGRLSATKRVDLSRGGSVSFKLVVKNGGTVEGSAPATLVGMQGGVEVYNQTATVTDGVGNGGTTYAFPVYTPMAAGDITWTVTIADEDPDIDTATAVTTVVP